MDETDDDALTTESAPKAAEKAAAKKAREPKFDATRIATCPTLHGPGGLQAIIQDGHLFSPAGNHEYLGEYSTGPMRAGELPKRGPTYTREQLDALAWRQVSELVGKHGGAAFTGPQGKRANVDWLLAHV